MPQSLERNQTMPRLVVNPGSPAAWEIELKPGTNRLGRAEGNDFTISDGSISSSHCHIVYENGQVLVRDLGSTNGTMVNRAKISESVVQPGQSIHLGAVELLLQHDGEAPPTPAPSPAAPAMPPPPVRIQLNRPRIAVAAPAPAEEAPPPLPGSPPEAPPMHEPVTGGPSVCKYHPKTPARFRCFKCNRYFCDLCVNTLRGTKVCRSCGVEVTALQVAAAQVVSERGFFMKLPGAFIYPFKGFGVVVLIFATIAFAALGFIGGGLFGIGSKIVFYGFLFLFLQNVIHTTAQDEKLGLGFPSSGGLISAAFSLAAVVTLSFGVPIGLAIAKFFDVEVPVWSIIATALLGCFYFPMAFLAVAMKDSVVAANPLVVFPAIMKIPVQYLIASILLMGIFGFRLLGNALSAGAGEISFDTKDMTVLFESLGIQAGWAFVSFYLLTVNMRILGLLYNSNKDEFGWY